MKKFLGFLLILVFIVAIGVAFFIFRGEFHLGGKLDYEDQDYSKSVSASSQQGIDDGAESVKPNLNSSNTISEAKISSNHVIIRIDENHVFVDNDEVQNAKELQKLVEKKYADNAFFELIENDSILATHEWVISVFEELDIPLTGIIK